MDAEPPNESLIQSERPLGVSILTGLFLIGALIGVPSIIAILLTRGELPKELKELGISPWQVHLSAIVTCVLVLAAAVGLFGGKTWGWWFAAYYFFRTICQRLIAIVSIYRVVDKVQVSERERQEFLQSQLIRLSVALLGLLYLYRYRVLNYFGLTATKRKWFAIAGIVLVYAIGEVGFALLLRAMASNG